MADKKIVKKKREMKRDFEENLDMKISLEEPGAIDGACLLARSLLSECKSGAEIWTYACKVVRLRTYKTWMFTGLGFRPKARSSSSSKREIKGVWTIK